MAQERLDQVHKIVHERARLDTRIHKIVHVEPVDTVPVVGNYPYPPTPPSTYSIPGGATSVNTAAGLTTALAGGTAIDIVLEDGTYDKGAATYWDNNVGHRLYARNVGVPLILNGFQMTNGSGAIYRGLNFSITATTRTSAAGGACIHAWLNAGNSASNVQVLDCTFNGNGVLAYGVFFSSKLSCDALIVRRCVITDFLDDGMRLVMSFDSGDVVTAMTIEDVNIARIRRVVPGSAGGTAESGLMLGHKCNVKRIKVRDTGWMGFNCISAFKNSLIEHCDIDYVGRGSGNGGVGIYLEHKALTSTFRYIKMGQEFGRVKWGFAMEWPAGAADGIAAAHGNIIEDCVIRSTKDGVLMDSATGAVSAGLGGGNTTRRVKFIGQCASGIRDYSGNTDNIYNAQGNDYAEKGGAAVNVTTAHENTNSCGEITW